MSTFVRCDGKCGRELVQDGPLPSPVAARVELTIERAEQSGGGGIPAGTSHLCFDCARIAFAALREAP